VHDRYAFYNIAIQLSGKNYVVRYETQTGFYPAAWKPGNSMQVRQGRGRLYLTGTFCGSTGRNVHRLAGARNGAAVAPSGAPSHRDNGKSFFAGPAEQCHAERVASPGRAANYGGSCST
jgi:hypothetical protein